MEQEFKYKYKEKDCHTWFFENNLKGYSWYVPKGNDYINVGVGGLADKKQSIQKHWEHLIKKLSDLGFITKYKYKPKGYAYYIRDKVDNCRVDNVFIIGDAAGLATKDLGEGIQTAVESGVLAAKAISKGKKFSLKRIKKHSFPFFTVVLAKLFTK